MLLPDGFINTLKSGDTDFLMDLYILYKIEHDLVLENKFPSKRQLENLNKLYKKYSGNK